MTSCRCKFAESSPPIAAAPCSWAMTKRLDRKSTRLNSSHVAISYAVFCLKKKTGDAAAQHPQQRGGQGGEDGVVIAIDARRRDSVRRQPGHREIEISVSVEVAPRCRGSRK